jgi:hypothetical protein
MRALCVAATVAVLPVDHTVITENSDFPETSFVKPPCVVTFPGWLRQAGNLL